MSLIREDRIAETTTSTGTGVLTLGGAISAAFKAFASVCAIGDTFYGVIEGVDANGIPTGEWEDGLYTYSAANQITRTTVNRSSNANAAVIFSAGSKRVYISQTSAAIAAGLAGAGGGGDVKARARIDFSGAGATTITGFNVASVTRTGTSSFTITFTNPIVAANCSFLGSARFNDNASAASAYLAVDRRTGTGLKNSSVDVVFSYGTGVQFDPNADGNAGGFIYFEIRDVSVAPSSAGGASGLVKLTTLVAVGGETTLSITLPAGYTDIILETSFRSATGYPAVGVRFNGDASTIYNTWRQYGGALNGAGQSINSANFGAGGTDIAGAMPSTTDIAGGEFLIPNYARTDRYKQLISRHEHHDSGIGADQGYILQAIGKWKSTAAVTQVNFIISASSFAAGSEINMYGRG